MLLDLDGDRARTLLGAFRSVATAGGVIPLSGAAAGALTSLATAGLGVEPPELHLLRAVVPAELAADLTDAAQAATATEILAVAALVDGHLDAGRIDHLLAFAALLGVEDNWLDDVAKSLDPDLGPVIADMGDRNLRSVTDGKLDFSAIDDISAWLLPYDGDGADDGLGDRYRELGGRPPGTLGRAFWEFYDGHGFAFPGQPGAVNEIFATPHDCTHLLSGYDTSPQGELLVSTFTARMHPVFPMEGHILPVIYSWHLGIEFNKLAGSYRGALDAAKLWVAWERGSRTTSDTFAREFNLWELAGVPLEDVRRACSVPPLAPEHAASSDAVAGVDYRPIA